MAFNKSKYRARYSYRTWNFSPPVTISVEQYRNLYNSIAADANYDINPLKVSSFKLIWKELDKRIYIALVAVVLALLLWPGLSWFIDNYYETAYKWRDLLNCFLRFRNASMWIAGVCLFLLLVEIKSLLTFFKENGAYYKKMKQSILNSSNYEDYLEKMKK